MTQNKVHKHIVRDYLDYERYYRQRRELTYMQALGELESAELRWVEALWPRYPEYRSAASYLVRNRHWFTPRCRIGCMSEERAQHLGLCPWTDRDSALHTCFRCERAVCMECDAPVAETDMICYDPEECERNKAARR